MTKNTSEKDEKRVLVSNDIYATFASVRDTLKSRGVVDFTFSLFINHLLKKVPASAIPQIIEENTPKEFKVKMALMDESLMEEFLKLVENKEKKRHKEKITEISQ